MQCRFIDTGFDDAYTNMAIDEALLHECNIPVLRVYGWKPAAVSVGYNQDVEKEINTSYCKKNNISIVRRLTGGKAVFHDKEITYSFITPENNNLIPFEINESYKIIAEALVIALKEIGINAEIKKAPEKIATPICFNSANWYELLAGGKKISGSAQRRMDGKVLQHGPILIDFDYNKNASIFNSNNPIDNITNLKKRITSIKKELQNTNKKIKNNKNKIVAYKEIADAIKFGFMKKFSFEIINDHLSKEEKDQAERLIKQKYSNDGWNLRILKD
jgi:lipoyl(octanoyl) transferase